MRKSILITLIIPALVVAYFFDNIRGYYRFREFCSEHKDVVVYQKLESNVGWQFNLKNNPENKDVVAEYLYFLPQIKFFRFSDYGNRQSIVDARFVGAKRLPWTLFEHQSVRSSINTEKEKQENYEFKPVSTESHPIYQLEQFDFLIPNQIRLREMGLRVIDLRTNRKVLETSEISYRFFDNEIYNYNVSCGRFESIIKTASHSNIFKNN